MQSNATQSNQIKYQIKLTFPESSLENYPRIRQTAAHAIYMTEARAEQVTEKAPTDSSGEGESFYEDKSAGNIKPEMPTAPSAMEDMKQR